MTDQTVINIFLTPILHEAGIDQRKALICCVLIVQGSS